MKHVKPLGYVERGHRIQRVMLNAYTNQNSRGIFAECQMPKHHILRHLQQFRVKQRTILFISKLFSIGLSTDHTDG